MSLRIVNPALYLDRTVQNWHRTALPADATATDLDLMGYCSRCCAPLYLIEATTRGDKTAPAMFELARRANVPALIIRHDRALPVAGREVWPHRRLWSCADDIRTALLNARAHHIHEHHEGTL
jgi:hypothetical protein